MVAYYEFQDAEKQMMKVMNGAFGVDNPPLSALLNTSSKVICSHQCYKKLGTKYATLMASSDTILTG